MASHFITILLLGRCYIYNIQCYSGSRHRLAGSYWACHVILLISLFVFTIYSSVAFLQLTFLLMAKYGHSFETMTSLFCRSNLIVFQMWCCLFILFYIYSSFVTLWPYFTYVIASSFAALQLLHCIA